MANRREASFVKRNPESFSSATSIIADARSRRAAMDRHGERFDDVARSLAALPTRRRFLGLALGGVLAAARLGDAEARKRRKRKKSCGICEKKKKGKCKPRPDGLACGEGQVCRKGRCECQEKCGAGGECLAGGAVRRDADGAADGAGRA